MVWGSWNLCWRLIRSVCIRLSMTVKNKMSLGSFFLPIGLTDIRS